MLYRALNPKSNYDPELRHFKVTALRYLNLLLLVSPNSKVVTYM